MTSVVYLPGVFIKDIVNNDNKTVDVKEKVEKVEKETYNSTKEENSINEDKKKKNIRAITGEKDISLISTENLIETFTDKSNLKIRTAKTNSCYGEEYPTEPSDRCCCWCRYPCNESSVDIPCMGIPIQMEKNNIWMEGTVCSFECCYAFLLDHKEKIPEKQDPLYSKSIGILKNLYQRFNPGGVLKPANDWKLLDKVGFGSMSISQFRSKLFTFNRTTNVKYLSAQVSYHSL